MFAYFLSSEGLRPREHAHMLNISSLSCHEQQNLVVAKSHEWGYDGGTLAHLPLGIVLLFDVYF